MSGAQEGDKLHKDRVATEADSMHCFFFCASLVAALNCWCPSECTSGGFHGVLLLQGSLLQS